MIYDCFQFNGELDLLEIRLHHHDSFVDKFVISECPWTYSGLPKRLYFNEVKNHEPFVKFKDKIIHRIYRIPPNGNAYWVYEHDQRNNLRGFDFKDDDLILYLDCDEIIRSEKVVEEAAGMDGVIALDMKLCWYYFNCVIEPGSEFQSDYSMEECFDHRWKMGRICRKKHLSQFNNLYEMRQYSLWSPQVIPVIRNSGWHFSNLGSPDSIFDKLAAFSHGEELSDRYDISPGLIHKRKAELRDPLGRDVSFVQTELDVPPFVLENIDRYEEYILHA